MGGSSTTTKSDSGPWAAQQPYLMNLFGNAQSNYNQNMATGPYQGNYYAAPQQAQYDAYGNAISQAGVAQGVNSNIMSTGQNIAAEGAGGATNALGNLQNFANTNQTQNTINSAQQYAAGEDIPGMVKAGMAAANRNAAESDIPNIYRAAAASGGLNSDRAALAQGVVERGLGEQAQNLTAQYQNQAYQNGLSNAQQTNAQGLQAYSQLGSLGSELNNLGTNQQTTAINNQGAINNQQQGAANGLQGLDQNTINNLLAKYQGQLGFGTDQLTALKNILGGNYGSQDNKTTQNNPSALSTIGSLIGGITSLIPK
jgi:hypothetical protein